MTNLLMVTKDKEKEQAVRALCAEQGLSFRKLGSGDLTKTVGELAGLPALPGGNPQPAAGAPGMFAPQELLIFCGMKRAQLDAFLDESRRRGIPPTPLKAVMTPTNSGWTVGRLTLALMQEQKQMDPAAKKKK